MGTFAGHAVPGSCFILISLWWCISIYRQYFKSRCSGTKFRSATWFPLDDYPNFPLESLVKLLLVVIGITGETVTGFDDNGMFVHINNGQHITMFFFFGVQAMVEILRFYGFAAVPPNMEYFTSVLGFFMEGLLFYFHLHGRSHLDMLVHTLLVVAISGCCVSISAEWMLRHSPMVTLSRAFWTLVQGTWFYHVGFILYPPISGMKGWDPEDHHQMMLVTMYFTWHCAVDFAIILLVGGLVSLRYRRSLAAAKSRGLNDGNGNEVTRGGLRMMNVLSKDRRAEFEPLNQLADSDSDGV